MTDFNLLLKNIEVLITLFSTLIGLAFIAVDVWRSLSSVVLGNYLDNPLQSLIIASIAVTGLFSCFVAIVSGETGRDIIITIVRAVVFAAIPFIPGYMIFNWANDLLTKIILTILIPLLAAVVEISFLDIVISSCNNQCAMVAPLTDSLLVRRLLDFSAKDNPVFQQFLSWFSLEAV